MMQRTNVAETFRDGTVFVTGSTGFLGKILTEKLLRLCPVKNVAVLVRSKKGLTAEHRMAEIAEQDLFEKLRKERPDFVNHIKIINGNLEDPSIGLSPTDRTWIVENVNFVFHCAATIKFNEPLEFATKINVKGTENVLALATEMKKLKGFVHVSTAYSHCPRFEIKEQYYPVPITAKELSNMYENTPNVVNNWPNTYTFTKAVTEHFISTNANRLPISIFRPSIIGCSKSEPSPGWVDNMNGTSGIVIGIIVGFLRTIPMAKNKVADIVPADYAANALITVMWDTVYRCQDVCERNKKPKIYNYVSCAESPVTWGKYITEMYYNHYKAAPPLQARWYGFYITYTNLWVGKLLRFFLHRISATLTDLLLYCSGKKPIMLRMYAKTEHMADLLYLFLTSEWKFDNSNTRELWSTLSPEDRNTFWFSLENFDWKSYIGNNYYGIRKHLLHEDLNNLSKALPKHRKLFWIHTLFIVFIACIMFQIFWMSIRYSF